MCVRERGRMQSICLIENYAKDSNQALTCEAKPDVSAHRKLFIKCLRFCFSSNAKMKINSHIFLGGKQNPPERLFLAWTFLVLRYCRHLNTQSQRDGEWQRQPTIPGACAAFRDIFLSRVIQDKWWKEEEEGETAWQSPHHSPQCEYRAAPLPSETFLWIYTGVN